MKKELTKQEQIKTAIKIIKYIFSLSILLLGYAIINSRTSSGLLILLLGILTIPYVSEKIKNRFRIWYKKGLRYTTYVSLFVLAIILSIQEKENKTAAEVPSTKETTTENNTYKTTNKDSIVKIKEEKTVSKLTYDEYLKEIKTLHSELMKFRYTPKFRQFGFGVGGPYNNWLKKAEKLEEDLLSSKLLSEKRISAGDLIQIGYAFVASNGEDTEYTESMDKLFQKAFIDFKQM